MKNLILIFTAFFHKKFIYGYMDEQGFRTSLFILFPIKNKKSFSVYNIRKKLIYECF